MAQRFHPQPYFSLFLNQKNFPFNIRKELRRGYCLPVYCNRVSKIYHHHSLLVGDAAALVDPSIGEGIYDAIRSGQLAAQTIHGALITGSGDLSAYQKRLSREIYREFRSAYHIAIVAYYFTRPGFAFLKAHPEGAGTLLRVCSGQWNYQKCWQRVKAETRRRP